MKFILVQSIHFYEKEKLLGINDKKENSLLYKFLLEEGKPNDGFIPRIF